MSEKQEVKEEKVSDGLAAKVRRIEDKLQEIKVNWIEHMNKYHEEGSGGEVKAGRASILFVSMILIVGLGLFAFAAEYLFNVPSEDDTLGIRMDTDGNVEVQALDVAGDTTLATATVTTLTTAGTRTSENTGTVAFATVTSVETGNASHKQVVLTMNDVVVTIDGSSGDGYGGSKVFTFPKGLISIEGISYEDIILTPDGVNLTNASAGDVGFGTAIATSNDLANATYVDFLAKTSIDPIQGTNSAFLAAETAILDGSTTAKAIYMNWLVDNADVAAISTNTVDGTITITYNFIGTQ